MLTWSQFKAQVIARITDRTPNDAAFFEAQAEYVRGRIVLDVQYDKQIYPIHANRYTSLRRKLCGYVPSANAAAQRTAVRDLVAGGQAGDTLFALAVSYWVKAHSSVEINRDSGESASWQKLYDDAYIGLLGYQHGFANVEALTVEVKKFLVADSIQSGATAFVDAHVAAAVSHLQGMNIWFTAQVAAAADDLSGLSGKVQKAIRTGAISIQEYVDTYRVGHTTTFTQNDVTQTGHASVVTMPAQARIKQAWVTYPDLVTQETTCRRREPVWVPWNERYAAMACYEQPDGSEATSLRYFEQISINPQANTLWMTPPLRADEIELELTWDGLKLDFADGDVTPFDEGVADAVANFVECKLAGDFGGSLADARDYERKFNDKRSILFLEARDRAVVARTSTRSKSGGGYRTSCSSWPTDECCTTSTMPTLTGAEERTITGAAIETLVIQPRITHYDLKLFLGAGAAAYIYVLKLSAQYRVKGNVVNLLIQAPSSTNPTLVVKDLGTDAALINAPMDGVAGWIAAALHFNGTSWEVWSWARVN